VNVAGRPRRRQLDSAANSAHNGFVPSRVRRFIVSNSLLLVVLSIVASPMADVRASAVAMACCAKTDYSCAGLSGPDDCCQHMGHAARSATPGTVSSARPLFVATVAVVPPLTIEASTSDSIRSISAFTRPHDPPHLHSYTLLI
jgi:hypothetical protein